MVQDICNSDSVSIAVVGEVRFPGFYSIRRTDQYSAVIMKAGGFLPSANTENITVRYGGKELVVPKQVRKAIETSQPSCLPMNAEVLVRQWHPASTWSQKVQFVTGALTAYILIQKVRGK